VALPRLVAPEARLVGLSINNDDMKKAKQWIWVLCLGALALTACDNTPTTLTVVNDYPIIEVYDTVGGQPVIGSYIKHTAMVYYGTECILTVEDGKAQKRQLSSSMMNRITRNLQVDMYNEATSQVDIPVHFNQKVKFVSNTVYTLTIGKNGGVLVEAKNVE